MLRPLRFQIRSSADCSRILCQIPHALEAELAPSLDYWKSQLDNYTYTPLPNFNGKKVLATNLAVTGRSYSTPLEKLQQQASALKVNPQVFFQAALAFLASFYFNNTDVTFGTVTSGRTIPVSGIEDIIGPCIATLPLRVDVSHTRTIKDLLLYIHELNRAMLGHCELPLLQQVDGADQLEFKLTLEFEPRSTGIVSRATFDPAVLPEAQVDILISQMEQLVNYFVEDFDGHLALSLERLGNSVLSIENAEFKHEEIHDGPAYAVEIRSEKTPEAPAVAFSHSISEDNIETTTISYRELNMRANRLANLLLAQNTMPDELVCICMEKSIDLYVSILATLKVGAGYVPITPETPLDRIQFILEEAQVRTCLTRSDCTADLRSLGNRNVINVDTADMKELRTENPNIPYDGSRIAYGVFTSGSTGTPKGVLVTQDNLVSNLKVLSEIYPCPQGSRLLQSCSQAFDVSVFEIFFSWYAGMCLCSGTKDELFQDMELAIRQMGITHLSLTPTVAALVNPDNVPNVKFLVTAGEAVTEHVKRTWAGKGLFQGYGPSETTNICTVRPNVTEEDLINNIGAPFTNTSAFVMDEAKDVLIPRGGVGELCFGGDQVYRGYLNMPDLTARKIINHPAFGRIYRSGDMGRLCPDGSILFTGRSDDQVKLRDKRKLTAMHQQLSSDYIDSVSRKSEEADDTGDWSDIERSIAAVLSEVVKIPVDEVRRQASFFAKVRD
ncbi:putative nonribosomal siderophore peptide synthase protein [Neofusicoccum parvum UCRNP2]|uniref:Putative nonribosomal siderophore peptide synthase protein n=1 Tax=Botryosphaeria parva (strain UCR-NP2) TaxID=1287680 RepID=R1EM64_BOTPV|nr:putative nonribosomal siderophore peptide synthase protein [Neofusicoccum parvum UCRNP2]